MYGFMKNFYENTSIGIDFYFNWETMKVNVAVTSMKINLDRRNNNGNNFEREIERERRSNSRRNQLVFQSVLRLEWENTGWRAVVCAGEEVSYGDKGGEDVRHHRRRLHHVLAPVLHHVRGARVLPELHPSNRLQRSILARLLQFRDQSLHLRALQQRLPLRLQENYLQVLLQATRQHSATRQRRQPIGNEVSVFIVSHYNRVG